MYTDFQFNSIIYPSASVHYVWCKTVGNEW